MLRKEIKEELIILTQKLAEKAIKKGNPPFGALLVDDNGKVIVSAYNTQNSSNDPIAHAEMNLLRKARMKLKIKYLDGYRIVTNAAPCSMCASACIKSRIRHFYYGAPPESSMNPNVKIFDLAKKSKNKVYIYPNILKKSCERQIKEGREAIHTD